MCNNRRYKRQKGYAMTKLDPRFHAEGETLGSELLDSLQRQAEALIPDPGNYLELALCIERSRALTHEIARRKDRSLTPRSDFRMWPSEGTAWLVLNWDDSKELVLLRTCDSESDSIVMEYLDGVRHRVAREYFLGIAIRQERDGSLRFGPKIEECEILPEEHGYRMIVRVRFDNGFTSDLLSYFPDELSFSPSDFIGRTGPEAAEMYYRRDVAYLRS